MFFAGKFALQKRMRKERIKIHVHILFFNPYLLPQQNHQYSTAQKHDGVE